MSDKFDLRELLIRNKELQKQLDKLRNLEESVDRLLKQISSLKAENEYLRNKPIAVKKVTDDHDWFL